MAKILKFTSYCVIGYDIIYPMIVDMYIRVYSKINFIMEGTYGVIKTN